MIYARRYFLRLTTGAVLTAICGIATAQARSAHVIVGYLRRGATDMIVGWVRQWLAARRDHPLVVEGQMNAQNDIAAGLGRSPHLVFSSTQTPVIDILRSWAHQKPADERINS